MMLLLRRQFMCLAGATTGAAILPGSAWPQSYPNKVIKIVVPFPAGGPTDLMGRLAGSNSVIGSWSERHHRECGRCRRNDRLASRRARKPRWLHALAGRHELECDHVSVLQESQLRPGQRFRTDCRGSGRLVGVGRDSRGACQDNSRIHPAFEKQSGKADLWRSGRHFAACHGGIVHGASPALTWFSCPTGAVLH